MEEALAKSGFDSVQDLTEFVISEGDAKATSWLAKNGVKIFIGEQTQGCDGVNTVLTLPSKLILASQQEL